MSEPIPWGSHLVLLIGSFVFTYIVMKLMGVSFMRADEPESGIIIPEEDEEMRQEIGEALDFHQQRMQRKMEAIARTNSARSADACSTLPVLMSCRRLWLRRRMPERMMLSGNKPISAQPIGPRLLACVCLR